LIADDNFHVDINECWFYFELSSYCSIIMGDE
jgi:hypothetical protein